MHVYVHTHTPRYVAYPPCASSMLKIHNQPILHTRTFIHIDIYLYARTCIYPVNLHQYMYIYKRIRARVFSGKRSHSNAETTARSGQKPEAYSRANEAHAKAHQSIWRGTSTLCVCMHTYIRCVYVYIYMCVCVFVKCLVQSVCIVFLLVCMHTYIPAYIHT